MREYLYGVHPVLEMLRAGRREARRAWLTQPVQGARLREICALLKNRRIPAEAAERSLLQRLCKSAEHQGVVVETTGYPYVDIEVLASFKRLLLLDNIEDPRNVGAVLRSALFFGWHGIMLSLRGVPGVYPSVMKTSAGAADYLSITRDRSANRYFRWLREYGYTICVLDAAGERMPDDIAGSSRTERLALVVGGEHRGVGQYIRMNADHVIGIKGCGPIDSLNASVAAGIALCRLATAGASFA